MPGSAPIRTLLSTLTLFVLPLLRPSPLSLPTTITWDERGGLHQRPVDRPLDPLVAHTHSVTQYQQPPLISCASNIIDHRNTHCPLNAPFPLTTCSESDTQPCPLPGKAKTIKPVAVCQHPINPKSNTGTRIEPPSRQTRALFPLIVPTYPSSRLLTTCHPPSGWFLGVSQSSSMRSPSIVSILSTFSHTAGPEE
jgi:hypothetical protein